MKDTFEISQRGAWLTSPALLEHVKKIVPLVVIFQTNCAAIGPLRFSEN